MSFRDNLQHLRSQRSMTQEQLAMLLGVSRQSISKWESEKAYPEMDKLLMICDLFGCTLDDLVLGDVRHPGMASAAQQGILTDSDAFSESGRPQVGFTTGASAAGAARPGPSAEAQHDGGTAPRGAEYSAQGFARAMPSDPPMRGTAPLGTELAQDVTGYDEQRRSFAWKIALGVFAMIAGVALGLLFDDANSIIGASSMNSFLLVLFIMLGVVLGLALIIPAGLELAEFKRRHPYVEDFYTDDDRTHATRSLAVGVVAGISVILFGVVVIMYASDVLRVENGWPLAIMVLASALGVGSLIYFGIMHGFMDLDQYNQEAKDEGRVKHEVEQSDDDFYGKLAGSICGIIMLIATIIGLWMLFTGGGSQWRYGDSGTWNVPFWIAWPIGGVLCGIVNIIAGIFRTANARRKGR